MNAAQAGIGYTAVMRRFQRRVRVILGSPNLWTAITEAAGILRNQAGAAINVRSHTGTPADASLMPSHFNGSPAGKQRA